MTTPAPSQPGPEHEQLGLLVGRWKTEGFVRPGDWGPSARIVAVDSYEWLDGGFFLFHRFDAVVGQEEVKGIEIIGYDPESKNYRGVSFDNHGGADTFHASLAGRVWKSWGPSQRFTGTFSADGCTLSGAWERSSDGTDWLPWMDVTLRRDHDARPALVRRRTAFERSAAAQATSATALGAAALGALAIGATAIGALAIGRLAVGSLALKQGRIGALTVDEIDVSRLRVGRVVTDGER
jgi:Protein of unknown function (DUF1579)